MPKSWPSLLPSWVREGLSAVAAHLSIDSSRLFSRCCRAQRIIHTVGLGLSSKRGAVPAPPPRVPLR